MLMVPPSRISMSQVPKECNSGLAGGAVTKVASIYLLLDNEEKPTGKSYRAKKPAQAAVKAFRAFIKMHTEVKDEPVAIRIQRIDLNKVYYYSVANFCITNPNAHELKHCIQKASKAIKSTKEKLDGLIEV